MHQKCLSIINWVRFDANHQGCVCGGGIRHKMPEITGLFFYRRVACIKQLESLRLPLVPAPSSILPSAIEKNPYVCFKAPVIPVPAWVFKTGKLMSLMLSAYSEPVQMPCCSHAFNKVASGKFYSHQVKHQILCPDSYFKNLRLNAS